MHKNDFGIENISSFNSMYKKLFKEYNEISFPHLLLCQLKSELLLSLVFKKKEKADAVHLTRHVTLNSL